MKKSILASILLTALAATLLPTQARAEIISINTVNYGGERIADEPDFDKEITDVANSIDRYNLAKVKINIVIIPSGDNASFDYGNIVNIPRSMQFSNEYGADTVYKTTMDIVSVFAHEYGHSIFDDHIGKALPVHAQLKKIKAEISDLLMKSVQTPLNDEQKKLVGAEIQKREDAIKANPEFIKIMRISMPYGELYADTIAVYNRDSKGAIFEALFNPKTPSYRTDELAHVTARDFGMAHDLNTWTDDSEHGMFAPLRSQIGDEKCWPKTDAQRSLKLKQLSQILISDIVAKYKSGKMPVIEDNRSLITQFKALCK